MGIINTVVGSESLTGYRGNMGPATAAGLYRPQAAVFSSNGDLFIADSWNHVIRKVVKAMKSKNLNFRLIMFPFAG